MDADRFDAFELSLDRAVPRRVALVGALGTGLTALLTRFGVDIAAARKKRRKKKKKCKGGKKKCGKGCCGAASACAVGICFCTGNEPQAGAKCRDVAATLIEIIAEETGIAPGVIGANPEEPLEEQVTIDEGIRLTIDEVIEKRFGVEEEVPYYTEGIAAGAAIIREELAQKD
jgi:hypothetical protein